MQATVHIPANPGKHPVLKPSCSGFILTRTFLASPPAGVFKLQIWETSDRKRKSVMSDNKDDQDPRVGRKPGPKDGFVSVPRVALRPAPKGHVHRGMERD